MANKLFSQLLRGTYNNATPYTIGDIVDYNGSSYACKANTTGNLPTDTSFWALLANKGDTGATGPTGPTGATGPTGPKGDNGDYFVWKGTYNGATPYIVGDAVSYEGSSYLCKLASTGNLPTNTTYWDLLAQKGTGDVDGPASATDNAVVRFDTTTGKLVQDSLLTISDELSSPTRIVLTTPEKSGVGRRIGLAAGNSSDNVGGELLLLSGAGNGANAGGVVNVQAAQGGATGNGGATQIIGGAGGSSSGNGGLAALYGGNATAGNSFGGNVGLLPGTGTGTGERGRILFYPFRGATSYALLNLDDLTAERIFTFPNQAGTFALRGTNTFVGQQVFDITGNDSANGSLYLDNNGGVLRLAVNNSLFVIKPLIIQASTIKLNTTDGKITAEGAINYGADAGSTDSYAITLDPALGSYYTGLQVIFKANTVNTGAATLNVNGLGAKTIVKGVNTTLANGDIAIDMLCLCVYDGTNFVLMNPRTL